MHHEDNAHYTKAITNPQEEVQMIKMTLLFVSEMHFFSIVTSYILLFVLYRVALGGASVDPR